MGVPTIQDLKSSQIWENYQTVIQIELWGTEFKAVMFSKTNGGLHFVEVAYYREPEKLIKLITLLNLEPTNKFLVLRRDPDGETGTNMGKW